MAPELMRDRLKRTRQNNDDDAELPAPGSGTKRRRVATDAASSPSTPKGFSAITSAIGSVLNFGRRSDPRKAPKSLSPIKPAVKIPTKPGSKRLAAQDIYDFPGSGDEDEGQVDPEVVPAVKVLTPRKGKGARVAAVKDIPSSRAQKGIPRAPRAEATEPVVSDDEVQAVARPSRSSAKRQGGATVSPSKAEGAAGELDESETEVDGDARTPSRSAGRHPRNRALDVAHQMKSSPTGILTPQHKKQGRPPKSVAFDKGESTIRRIDLDGRASKLRSQGKDRSAKSAAAGGDDEGDEEDQDDEVCVICSKPDSKPPNQILFCENCDKAVHQECYDVPVIPEDDWFCRECLQKDILSSTTTKPGAARVSELLTVAPDIPNFSYHLSAMQRVLIDRCSGKQRLKLTGQPEAYEKTFQLVEQTVLAGEGNSMMVIGARGCGKTTLVETVIADLATAHKDAFHVVRLNGFIHTDDKLALKEIWRQLGKEMEIEDDVNKTSNYADTLATLLALLSHPSEITGHDQDVTSKSVVFVIDEFDLFATHARQTLLYNLFDIAQARKAPIAVLGVTSRIDVVESLEKRVKSRFSHRSVHLSLPKSLPAYWEICKQGLTVDVDELLPEQSRMRPEGQDEFVKYWNDHIETLRTSLPFQDQIEYYFYATKSVSKFLQSWVLPLSALSTSRPRLTAPDSALGVEVLDAPDSKLHLLSALSDLDLALVIAAARLDIVAHTDTVNFAMAYDEYSSQMGKQRIQSSASSTLALGGAGRVWGRGVAVMAWERLVSLGLLLPTVLGARSNANHGGLEGRMWRLAVVLDEIPAAVELPGYLGRWCTQI